MDIASVWRGLGLNDRRSLYIALTLPIVSITAVGLLKSIAFGRSPPQIFRSPRKSLQLLSKQGLDDLPYPPDALPGARDIDSPYGNTRVYEWGPEDGRKVLFVHGISTPCIAFADMAKLLVEKGCRVMLFDLFGRGYSDAPDTKLYRQDIGLWTSQILLVLSSSKLAWTGTNRFTMVGYSMGGGISAAFTSYFPELVESLILIAPGGLLRPSRISRSSKLLYGNLLPDFAVKYFVGKRLRGSSAALPGIKSTQSSGTTPAQAAESEVPGHPANSKDSTAAMFPGHPQMSVANAVSWEVDAHPGFLSSFISSIKYAPVSNEHERWRIIGRRCTARKSSTDQDKVRGLNENKVLIIFGAQDPVIIAEETGADATEALGAENVTVVNIEGGHDVPVINAQRCVEAITEFLNKSPV